LETNNRKKPQHWHWNQGLILFTTALVKIKDFLIKDGAPRYHDPNSQNNQLSPNFNNIQKRWAIQSVRENKKDSTVSIGSFPVYKKTQNLCSRLNQDFHERMGKY
jgi:hypothetical protein